MYIVNPKMYLALTNEDATFLDGKDERPASKAQKAYLRNIGLGSSVDNRSLTMKEASTLITLEGSRRKKGLARPGQLVALSKMGITDVSEHSIEEASEIIASKTDFSNAETAKEANFSMFDVTVKTEITCPKTAGPGEYKVELSCKERDPKVFSKAFPRTSMNKLELEAITEAISKLKKPCNVTVETDNEAVASTIKNLEARAENKWKTKTGATCAYADLSKKLLDLLHNGQHIVTCVKKQEALQEGV